MQSIALPPSADASCRVCSLFQLNLVSLLQMVVSSVCSYPPPPVVYPLSIIGHLRGSSTVLRPSAVAAGCFVLPTTTCCNVTGACYVSLQRLSPVFDIFIAVVALFALFRCLVFSVLAFFIPQIYIAAFPLHSLLVPFLYVDVCSWFPASLSVSFAITIPTSWSPFNFKSLSVILAMNAFDPFLEASILKL